MTNPPQQPPFPQQAVQDQKKSGLAIASLVLGIFSFFTWIITGIPAIICGHIAKNKIKQSNGTLTGSGMAITGLVLGYVTIPLIFIIAALAALATPVILKQKKKAEMVETSSYVKQIYYHLVEYEQEHGKFPDSLDDLEMPSSTYNADDFKPRKGSWQYHGAGKNFQSPTGDILLSWEQESTEKWVVLYIDGSAEYLPDSKYQIQLSKQ